MTVQLQLHKDKIKYKILNSRIYNQTCQSQQNKVIKLHIKKRKINTEIQFS